MSCCPGFTAWNGNYKYTNGVSSASVGVAKSLMIPEIQYNADDCLQEIIKVGIERGEDN